MGYGGPYGAPQGAYLPPISRKTQISLSLGVARIFGKVSVYFLWGICGSKTLPDRFKMRGTLASSFLRAGDGARSRDLGTGRRDLPENRAAA